MSVYDNLDAQITHIKQLNPTASKTETKRKNNLLDYQQENSSENFDKEPSIPKIDSPYKNSGNNMILSANQSGVPTGRI